MRSKRLYSFVVCTVFVVTSAQALPAMDFEAKLKTAYIVNFTGFIDWRRPLKDVRLCLLPSTDIYNFIKPLDNRRLDQGRSLKIIDDFNDLSECDIYYEDNSVIKPSFDVRSYKHLLAISDSRSALARGFHVQLFVRNLKLRFAINHEIIDTASFQISSKLLRLAREVE